MGVDIDPGRGWVETFRAVVRALPAPALLALLLTVCAAGSPAFAEQRVRVGVYENSPKITFSRTGEPEGIFIDLIEAIAAREDWLIEYVPGTWGEGLDRLEAGQIDLMPDVALTPERERRFAFHREPVLSSWMQVYARRGSNIRSLLDLAGRRVAVLERSVQQNFFNHMVAGFGIDVELVERVDFESAFAAVTAEEADAVVTNRFFGALNASRFGLEDTAILFSPSKLFFAAPPHGRSTLLDGIDRRLLELKRDPSSIYYASYSRWVAGEQPVTLIPSWLPGAVAGALGLLLISACWVVLLRRQVKAKTAEIRARNEDILAINRNLRLSGAQLEERVAERTEALEVANRDLIEAKLAAESADRLKSAFLATMSHELRTPLNSIIGFTGIILQGLAGPLSDEQRKQLGMVRDSARHLLALINDVLDISRIEADELSVAREPFDLRTSVEKVVSIAQPLANRKDLHVNAKIGDDVRKMTGDARRVEQVLLNLLSNAIKFTDSGTISLRVETVTTPCMQGERPRPAVRLQVADSGMGIRQEDMGNLFKPFRQIESTLSRVHEGTGLGLAICRRLTRLMGGSIEAQSEWQKGSVFTVTLPIEPPVTEDAP